MQVAVDHGLHIGRKQGRRSAFEFAELARHLVAAGHEHTGQGRGDQLRQLLLMHRIGIGVEQADGDGAIAAVLEGGNQSGADRRLVERCLDRSVSAQALRGLEAVLAADRRRRLGVEEIVDVAPVVALHEQQVAEACCRDKGYRRALAFQNGIGGDSRAVAEILYARQVDARGGECREGADVGAPGRARHFGDDDAATLDRHEVGKGAADFHADTHWLSARPAWLAARRSASSVPRSPRAPWRPWP